MSISYLNLKVSNLYVHLQDILGVTEGKVGIDSNQDEFASITESELGDEDAIEFIACNDTEGKCP